MYSPTRDELLPFISILLTTPSSENITNFPLCDEIDECAKCIAVNTSGEPSLCRILDMFKVMGDYETWLDIRNYSRSLFPSTEFPEYYL